jgi:hypothetical protein
MGMMVSLQRDKSQLASCGCGATGVAPLQCPLRFFPPQSQQRSSVARSSKTSFRRRPLSADPAAPTAQTVSALSVSVVSPSAGRAPELHSMYPVAVAPGMSVEYKGEYRVANPPLDHFRALGFGDGYQCSLSDPNVRWPSSQPPRAPLTASRPLHHASHPSPWSTPPP